MLASLYFLTLSLSIAAQPISDSQPGTTAPASAPTQSPAILMLDSQEPNTEGEELNGALSLREFVRQAVLLAGREELGLSTRDGSLREPFPEKEQSLHPPIHIKTSITAKVLRIDMWRDNDPQKRAKYNAKIPLNESFVFSEELERRSRGEFADFLRRAGYSGPAARTSTAAVPEGVEALLGEMVFTSQFEALRRCHEAIRTQGESAALDGALVRAYANLGTLTRFQWNAFDKVFMDRAMLYAARMTARDPKSPFALWHRAYARTLGGAHAVAIADFEAAAKLTTSMPATDPDSFFTKPLWARYAEAFVRYDTNFLRTAAESHARQAQLATLLSFLAIAPSASHALIGSRGQEALTRLPECFIIYDFLCPNTPLGVRHMATEGAPTRMTSTLMTRVASVSKLPAAFKASLKRQSGGGFLGLFKSNDEDVAAQAGILRDLVKASETPDLMEPSCAVIGRIMQDTLFSQVYRRCYFLKYDLAVPTEDYVAQTLPLVADHPYAGLIRSYSYNWNQQRRQYEDAVKDLNLIDVTIKMMPAINATYIINTPGKLQGHRAWEVCFKHMDRNAWDVACSYENAGNEHKKAWAHVWESASPQCPPAFAALVTWDWEYAAPHAKEWEEKYGYYPSVLSALGSKYIGLKKFDDAERCLRKFIKLAPEKDAYVTLAGIYWDRGKKEQWLETLQEFLKQPSMGLEHAQVQVKIARYYMGRKEWHKAAPYAEAAAQTWAGWAMQCACECYEGAGEWGKSEEWIQREAERYEEQTSEWFFWCRRTGHGDAEAARTLAETRLERIKAAQNWKTREEACVLYTLMGKPAEALKQANEAYEKGLFFPRAALRGILVADQLKDNATRDRLIKSILDKNITSKGEESWELPMLELARIMEKAIKAGPTGGMDSEIVDNWYDSTPPGDRTNLAYFVGQFALDRGQEDLGKRYLLKAAVGAQNQWSCAQACDALRKRGVPVQTQPATTEAQEPAEP